MTVFLLMLIVPGLVCCYALILRPVLRKVPALAKFYNEADGFWATVWAYCGNSATIAAHYVVGGIGAGFALLDPLASALGDPGLKDQITSALAGNPKAVGYAMIAISVITIAARLRSIAKG